jgi:ABC-type spermidine/putrescine transport system permease subunit II
LLILIGIPLVNLVVRCCYYVRPVDGVPTPGYSLQQFAHTLGRACRDYTAEFTWSILIAGTSATLILILAVAISWKARKSRIWQIILVLTLAISCALPGPLIGNLVTKLFMLSDTTWMQWLYNRTIAAPVLTNVSFCWPLGPLVVWFVFRKIAEDVLESSRTEGAGEFGQLLRFGLLANFPAIAGCWLLTFAFCFGELSASQTVLPPGIDTVPRLMLGLLHAGVNEMTAALTLVTVGGILLVSLSGWWLIRFRDRHSR